MGYTHYWNTSKVTKEQWDKKFPTVKKELIAALEPFSDLIQRENDDPSAPLFDKHHGIWYNGIDELGHETFVVQPEKEFEFCKTNHKPYDIAVCVSLGVLKAHFPKMDVSSDGIGFYRGEDYRDPQWEEAASYLKTRGYNMSFREDDILCKKQKRLSKKQHQKAKDALEVALDYQ